MPNGFYGPAEEWERMEAPFRKLDRQLEEFAEAHGMSVVKNYHNWPGRRLDWGESIRRSIQLARVSGPPPSWSVLVGAYEDRDGYRYSKHEVVVEKQVFEGLQARLKPVLEDALTTAGSWNQEDLARSGRLSRHGRVSFFWSQVLGWLIVVLAYGVPLVVVGYLLFRVASCAAV